MPLVDEQATKNRLIKVIGKNSLVEYAKNLAATEFGTTDEVEELFAIAA